MNKKLYAVAGLLLLVLVLVTAPVAEFASILVIIAVGYILSTACCPFEPFDTNSKNEVTPNNHIIPVKFISCEPGIWEHLKRFNELDSMNAEALLNVALRAEIEEADQELLVMLCQKIIKRVGSEFQENQALCVFDEGSGHSVTAGKNAKSTWVQFDAITSYPYRN